MVSSSQDFYCLTTHGTFLCFDSDQSRVAHQFSRGALPETAMRFKILPEVQGRGIPLVAIFSGTHKSPLDSAKKNVEFTVVSCAQNRTVHLFDGWRYLCAKPDGSTDGRVHPQGWETFMLLDSEEAKGIVHLVSSHWREHKTKLINPEDSFVGESFQIAIGEHKLDLKLGDSWLFSDRRHALGAEHRTQSVQLFSDGWKLGAKLTNYRPIVYYTAFGNPAVFEQLRWSLLTLKDFGAYKNEILVITDLDEKFLDRYIPEEIKDKLHVFNIKASNFIDYCLARYKIIHWPSASSFGPFLYVDTDIAFDSDINPMLLGIASQSHVCAAGEFGARLDTVDTVGAFLFKEAKINVDEKTGFNAGCLGFPNMERSSEFLNLVLAVSEKYILHNGKKALHLADQPVANYVSHHFSEVDTAIVSGSTRIGFNPVSVRKSDRLGMVHFWPARGQEAKMDAMETFYRNLLEEPEEALARDLR